MCGGGQRALCTCQELREGALQAACQKQYIHSFASLLGAFHALCVYLAPFIHSFYAAFAWRLSRRVEEDEESAFAPRDVSVSSLAWRVNKSSRRKRAHARRSLGLAS